ncbi:hypothetical protein Syun_030277 [Stephania yunnanensis]|uniref:Rhodanese domain-containing protein n=1 Tax=Stephania yunnanensis TaxID=152371 RepID=A0AAP0HGV0_9MAGN
MSVLQCQWTEFQGVPLTLSCSLVALTTCFHNLLSFQPKVSIGQNLGSKFSLLRFQEAEHSARRPSQFEDHLQVSLHSGLFKSHLPLGKAFDVKGIVEDKVLFGVPNGIHPREGSLKIQATKFLSSHVIERAEASESRDFLSVLNDGELSFSRKWLDTMETVNRDLTYVENSSSSITGDELLNLPDQVSDSATILQEPTITEPVLASDASADVFSTSVTSASKSSVVAGDAVASLKTNIKDIIAGFGESINASVDEGNRFFQSTSDAITSSINNTTKSVTGKFDDAVNSLLSNVDRTGEVASNKLTGVSGGINKTLSQTGTVAIDALRKIIIALEYSLESGTRSAVYFYGSAKELLPSEVKEVLSSTEVKTAEILNPVGTALTQVYVIIQALEANLGLDPNDPVVPFFLFLGTSATLGISYWALTYGGYSGDLSPTEAFELLKGDNKAVLIDDLRERDGIPDLRRGARFKYASVALPKADGSLMKLMKSKKDLENALFAAIIRNLKIVEDRSEVMIMDADGTQSKGIARSLRKLGAKQKPYIVQGGYQSWVKSGLRFKELKSETALTILNEEAEAILEAVRPTPVQFLSYGVGLVAVGYALLEWEKTLQYIAIFGLGLTLYRRIASYENSEDFKQDVTLVLSPVRVGAQAISWAAGKLEKNKLGLPTSPSSSAVQDRVLQAAAKHESQPSDLEETQDPSRDSSASISERVDLSEA